METFQVGSLEGGVPILNTGAKQINDRFHQAPAV